MHKNRNRFHEHINSSIGDFYQGTNYSDVTLVSDEKTFFQAHRLVLSAYSSALKDDLLNHPNSKPIIYIKGVSHIELSAILQFMYYGKIEACHERTAELLKATKDLQIQKLPELLQDNKTLNKIKVENPEASMTSRCRSENHQNQQNVHFPQ